MASQIMKFGSPGPQGKEGQFERMPVSPQQVLLSGGRPEKWQPGLGDGSAPCKTGVVPWPNAKAPPLPFKNLSNGRTFP